MKCSMSDSRSLLMNLKLSHRCHAVICGNCPRFSWFLLNGPPPFDQAAVSFLSLSSFPASLKRSSCVRVLWLHFQLSLKDLAQTHLTVLSQFRRTFPLCPMSWKQTLGSSSTRCLYKVHCWCNRVDRVELSFHWRNSILIKKNNMLYSQLCWQEPLMDNKTFTELFMKSSWPRTGPGT